MENELAIYEERPLTVADVLNQVALIQKIMREVMRKDEHYGIIPGCEKPSLYKPGAEKLNLTFRMSARFEGEREPIDLGNGHREYVIKCSLFSIQSDRFLGQGVGSCSTMESKYRYRNADPEITDKPVPKEYWDLRKKDLVKAQEMIGGKGFITKKVDNSWMVAKLTGEKVEYENPADFYNTILKMAKKRAHVDATLNVTAASDIFTQDIEEMVENGTISPGAAKREPISAPQEKKEDKDESSTQSQHKAIFSILSQMKITDDHETHETISKILNIPETITSMTILTKSQASKAIELLQGMLKK